MADIQAATAALSARQAQQALDKLRSRLGLRVMVPQVVAAVAVALVRHQMVVQAVQAAAMGAAVEEVAQAIALADLSAALAEQARPAL